MKSSRYTISIFRTLIVLVIFSAFGGGLYLLQKFQVKRSAVLFLKQGEQAKAEGKLEKAIENYYRYIHLTPNDHDARAEWALLRADNKVAKTPRQRDNAFFLLEAALRTAPSDNRLRWRTVEIAMDRMLQRYDDAAFHIDHLIEVEGKSAKLLAYKAECHRAKGEHLKARLAFEAAFELPPKQREHVIAYARLLREYPSDVRTNEDGINEVNAYADKVMENLVVDFAEDFEAHIAYVNYIRQYLARVNDETARKAISSHLAKARALAPENEEVLIVYADFLREENQTDLARKELEKAVALHPKSSRIYTALASLYVGNNQPSKGIETLESGLKEIPDDPDMLWSLAHLWIRQNSVEKAERSIEQLQKVGLSNAFVEYLRARMDMFREEWARSLKRMKRIYPELDSKSRSNENWFAMNVARECNLMMASCLERLADFEGALTVYQRMKSRSPASITARLGVAKTEALLGRTDSAVREYNELIQTAQTPPSVWADYARLLITRNLKDKTPNWSSVETVLSNCEKRFPDFNEVVLVRAEAFAAQRRIDDARKVLVGGEKSLDNLSMQNLIYLAQLDQSLGNTDQALAFLVAAEKKFGDQIEVRLARCRYWRRQGGLDAKTNLEQLVADTGKISDDDRVRLYREVASAFDGLGDLDRSERLLKQIAETKKNDISVQMGLFSISFRKGDQAELDKIVETIKQIENGPATNDVTSGDQDGGVIWRYASVLTALKESEKVENPDRLKAASVNLEKVLSSRPSWAQAHAAMGDLFSKFGQPDQAIVKYREAIVLGEESPQVIRRLAYLLSVQDRFDEADELLKKLRDRKQDLGFLNRAAAEIEMRRNNPTLALEFAETAVSPDSKSFSDQLWLAQVYRATKKDADAERSLKKAIELAPSEPSVHVAWVRFLFGTKQLERASSAIDDAKSKVKKDRLPLTLGQCYAICGKHEEAKANFKKAAEQAPQDSKVLLAAARYHLVTNDLPEAKNFLDQIVTLQTADSDQARRTLAILLWASSNLEDKQSALKMLGVADYKSDVASVDSKTPVEDLRAKAMVLSQYEHIGKRRLACRYLEDLLARKQIQRNERFLLAQLYDFVGERTKAREQFSFVIDASNALLREKSANQEAVKKELATELATFVAFLVRTDSIEQAESWLSRLKELDSDTIRVHALNSQILHKSGRTADAKKDLLQFAEKNQSHALRVAMLLQAIEQFDDAEKVLRDLTKDPRNEPAARALAELLAKRDRLDDGIRLLEPFLSYSSESACVDTVARCLLYGKPSSKQIQQVAALVQKSVDRNPKNWLILDNLATVKRLQSSYDEMIGIYQKIVEINPNEALSYNNLAWLQTMHLRNPELGLKSIQKAIELRGPLGEFLDTRAVIYLKLKDLSQAKKDIDEALAEAPTAYRYYHLAVLHRTENNNSAFQQAIAKAKKLGISETDVDPLERQEFLQIMRDNQ